MPSNQRYAICKAIRSSLVSICVCVCVRNSLANSTHHVGIKKYYSWYKPSNHLSGSKNANMKNRDSTL